MVSVRPLFAGLAAMAVLCTPAAADLAPQRIYLTGAEVQKTLIGRGIVSRNLTSGMVSHWEFRADGSVDFVNRSGPGQASGRWTVRPDGLMCVTMLTRTGCRYWYRQGDTVANAESNAPDAPAVAEVRFDSP